MYAYMYIYSKCYCILVRTSQTSKQIDREGHGQHGIGWILLSCSHGTIENRFLESFRVLPYESCNNIVSFIFI